MRRIFFCWKTCYKIQKGYVNLNTKTSWYVTRIDLLSCNNTMTGGYCHHNFGVTSLSFHFYQAFLSNFKIPNLYHDEC